MKYQKKLNTIHKLLPSNNFILHWLVCLLLISGIGHKALAIDPTEAYQQETIQKREFSKTEWQKKVNGLDYFSKEKPKNPNQKKSTQKEPREGGYEGGGGQASPTDPPESPPLNLGNTFGNVLTTIAIILGICVVIMILLYLLKEGVGHKNPKLKTSGEAVSLEDIESNLSAHDPSDLIQKAILADNHKLAIRLYYLKVLRELSLVGKIVWKKDKTNREYVYELNTSPLQPDFKEATLIFERTWYGDLPVTPSDFVQIKPTFDGLLQKIRAL